MENERKKNTKTTLITLFFWQWCRDMVSKGHTVFVSEYNAPDDFECVWSKQVASVLGKKGANKKPIEQLFTLNSFFRKNKETI